MLRSDFNPTGLNHVHIIKHNNCFLLLKNTIFDEQNDFFDKMINIEFG